MAAKLENEMVEHLSDHLSEFVALHVVALLDPIVRSGDADGILIRPGRRPILMLQLARLLQNSQCQQLVCSALGISRQKKYLSFSRIEYSIKLDPVYILKDIHRETGV